MDCCAILSKGIKLSLLRDHPVAEPGPEGSLICGLNAGLKARLFYLNCRGCIYH
jgi:hypothetical protein